MASFIIKLAVAIIPLFVLVASIKCFYAHQPLSWHRRRRHSLRALATGTMLR